jgi:protein-S-isoprenylcysteine O-methyltransferase Ste14
VSPPCARLENQPDRQPPVALRYLETKIPAPVIAAVAGAFMKFHEKAAGVTMDPTPLRMYIGVGLAQASAVVVLAAFASFFRARTTINPLDPARATSLVTGGVFRVSRNPMYLSLLLLLAGYAVRLDSPVVWLGPILFVAYVNRFQIKPEERVLKAKFGEAYLRYRMRTRRWL